MKAELMTRGPGPLVGKAPGDLGRREFQAPRLERRAGDPPDEDVLRKPAVELQLPRRLQQPPRPKRKAAIPDVMPVVELRPDGPDIVIAKELRVPGGAVQDEAVPL